MFTRISRDDRTEMYSDGILDITIQHPLHHTNGFPCIVTVTECNDPHAPAQDNAKVEGEDAPPATPAEFENL